MSQQNFNHERVKLLISLVPGLHLRAVQRLLGLSFSSTRYHVDALQKSGEIVRSQEGGYSRLYPNGISESDKILFSTINNETDRRILSCMVRNPSTSSREMYEQTGYARSTISEHLSRLIGIGVVAEEVIDGHTKYMLTNPDKIRAIMSIQNPTMLKRATDRFIDLWDF